MEWHMTGAPICCEIAVKLRECLLVESADAERLREAQVKARKAIEELIGAQLSDRHLPRAHKAHLRWRFANPDQVVDRLLSVTLLDRLEISGL
jgi:hypothetical protein